MGRGETPCDHAHPTSPDPLTHYVVVRGDLPRGLLAAQVTHAAGESSPGKLPAGTHAVVLTASPDELLALQERLSAAGVPHVIIRDRHVHLVAGEKLVPYGEEEPMAIGLEPAPRSLVRRHVSSLPLLR